MAVVPFFELDQRRQLIRVPTLTRRNA